MKRIPVSSSNLASVGYDNGSQSLEIEFQNGSIYQYYQVPERIHVGLMNAPSKGRYHHQFIRNAGYRYRKIRGPR